MKRLAQELDNVLLECFGDDEESRKQYATAKLEEAFQEAVVAVFKGGASFVLPLINMVFIKREERGAELIVYSEDSAVRSSLDARQGLLKHFLIKQGVFYDTFTVLPSKRTIKERHPYKYVPVKETPLPKRTLSEQELAAIEEFVAPLDDEIVKEAFKKALISDFQTRDTKFGI